MKNELVEKLKKNFEEMIKSKVKELEKVKDEIEQTADAYLKYLVKASKIILPVNIMEILANGGYVDCWEVKIPYSNQSLTISVDGCPLKFNAETSYSLELKKGKYRITLIVEKLEGE